MKLLLLSLMALNLTACAGAKIMANGFAEGLQQSSHNTYTYTSSPQYAPKQQVCVANALNQLVCTEQ